MPYYQDEEIDEMIRTELIKPYEHLDELGAKIDHVRREVQMAKDILNTGQVESLAILRSLISGLEVILDG